jgi:hypothetical protein
MSTAVFDNFAAPNNQPANFPYGIRIASGNTTGINDIGLAGQRGFGVGICPGPLPTGMVGIEGYGDQASDNYGNYKYSDSSVMVWVPAFFYKVGTGSNGLALNKIDIKSFSTYATVAAANSAGYALHRAFYNAGNVTYGFFIDKYKVSNNGGIASSLRNGIVLTSGQRGTLSTAVYSALTGAPANTLGGSVAAAKTRGSSFFPTSIFQRSALAMLSVAHGQSATASTWCAWYDAAGITNFPKGNNNNALGDAQDGAITYVYDGNGTYTGCGKTGSANLFNRTTHNGQNCGIADLNGLTYDFCPGLTSDGTNYFLLNTSADMKAVTGGNTLAGDLWGATGYAAMYTNIGTTYGPLWATGANRSFGMGSATQVLSEATSGTAWAMAGAGIPLATGIGGTNMFGNDVIYDYKPNEMAPILGGNWADSSGAGVWSLALGDARSDSTTFIGFRSALYL